MRYFLFEKIQAEDNLALLFNAYAEGLCPIEQLAMPRESMQEYLNSWSLDKTDPLHPCSRTERYYELSVLNNSLHGIHRSVTNAITLLETFFRDYQGDTLKYAIASRIKVIEEFGSDDPSDWTEQNEIVVKTDPFSLENYTIYQDLSQYFEGNGMHGEYLGSSTAKHFDHLTILVANKTAFCITKFFQQQGNAVTLYQTEKDGTMKPQTLADQIEAEMNEDIINGNIAALFTEVITMGTDIRESFEEMDKEDPKAYLDLLTSLRHMLALQCG